MANMEAKCILLLVSFLCAAGLINTVAARGNASKKVVKDLAEFKKLFIKDQTVKDERITALEKFKEDVSTECLKDCKEWQFIVHNARFGLNLALGKRATQSSHFIDVHHNGAAAAVDGNLSGDYKKGESCTHTKSEPNPWWSVDFGSNVYIGRLVIKNRQDCCGERLRNFNVNVCETSSSAWKTVAKYPGTSHNGEVITIGLEKKVLARHLRIQLQGTEYLTLCEVQVFYD